MEITNSYDFEWVKVNIFVANNFGFDPEEILNDHLDDDFSESDFIEYLNHFVTDYDIEFENGNIVSYNKITLNDRIRELVYYYDELPDAQDKCFDTLDEAMILLREIAKGE